MTQLLATLAMANFANSVTLAQFFSLTASSGTNQEPPTQATLFKLR